MNKAKIIKFLGIPLALSVGFISYNFAVDTNLFEINKQLDIYATLIKELNTFYVEESKPEKLTKKALEGMLASLDPYTEFYPESELEDYKMRYVSAEYGGVGALVHERDGKIFISEPYEGFPAQKNDLRAGDEIVSIDGKAVTAKQVSMVSDMLKGQPHTKLKIVIRRPGEKKTIEKIIEREEIKFGNISYSGVIDNEFGYIKLDKFLSNSAAEFKFAFNELKRQNIKSLIVDLRGNGGGILQDAVQIVNTFVNKDNEIVTQKGKLKEMNTSYKATSIPLDTKIPLVILVDTATASASEITAGALQDLDRAVIIGQRTFGKGLVQQTKPLPYNAQLKLTVAKYYIPSGRCVQAINYSKKNSKGGVDHVPDSLITEYKTKGGRKVYDGSGIAPDIKMDLPPYSNLLYNLITKNVFFDFATNYKLKNPTIAQVEQFKLSDDDYNAFVKYVAEQKFTYTSASDLKLEEIKKAAIAEKYYDRNKDAFEALKKKVTPELTEDLKRFKPEVSEFLENEIVSRYYFQKGRMRSLLKYDVEVAKAKEILRDQNTYSSILSGKGDFAVIGSTKKN